MRVGPERLLAAALFRDAARSSTRRALQLHRQWNAEARVTAHSAVSAERPTERRWPDRMSLINKRPWYRRRNPSR